MNYGHKVVSFIIVYEQIAISVPALTDVLTDRLNTPVIDDYTIIIFRILLQYAIEQRYVNDI